MESEPVKTGSGELTELVKTGSNESDDSVKTGSNESAEPTTIGSELVNTASVESDMFEEEEEEDSMRLYLEPDTEKTDSSDELVLSSQKEPAETTIDEKTG